jgi:hypothetical protein
MAANYLFFRPASLPLIAEEMDESSVLPIAEAEAVRCLTEAIPSLNWRGSEATGEVAAGWVEFNVRIKPNGGALSMRCSLRADYSPLVQQLCDRFGWVAFNESATCFQPALPTMQA